MSEQEKDNALREVRKLINILNTWGDTLVPSLDDKPTTASERLNHFAQKLIDTGMTMDDIDLEMSKL